MNDKLTKETKENINETSSDELKLDESTVEETVVEEAVEQKNEESQSSTDNKKNIKDYLSKDLFADIKRISFADDQPE